MPGRDVAAALLGHVTPGTGEANLSTDVVVQIHARRGRNVALHIARFIDQRIARRAVLRRNDLRQLADAVKAIIDVEPRPSFFVVARPQLGQKNGWFDPCDRASPAPRLDAV